VDKMKIDTKDMLKSILNSLSRIEHIKPEDIPNIDLYMDQVTTFMDTRLSSSKRHPEDKILTKTMINNYAKNKLLPPPVKKKYSKEHLLVMIFIYYFKGILSITDIQALMNPITEKYFQNDQKFSIETIYNEVFSLEKSQADKLAKDIVDKYNTSKHTFENVEKDQEFLQLFSFICMLSFDVYVKKQMIEKLIDQLPGE
jgi:DNA-binding transcriptional MerR regulator